MNFISTASPWPLQGQARWYKTSLTTDANGTHTDTNCWYVRPEILHYRCLTYYIPKTAKERVSETTEFSPETLTLPRMSSKDAASHATADLTHTLLNPTPNSPLKTLGDKKKSPLKQLAEIFNMVAPPQVTPPLRVNNP